MKCENLSLQLSQRTLLHSLAFDLPEPGISLILGPNGAGKTLFLRCLTGLIPSAEGQVRFEDGKSVTALSPEEMALRIAWTPLSAALPFSFKVSELMLMGRYRRHLGYPKKEDHEAVEKALDRLQLSSFRDRVYNSLSRGEQTKVDIARSIAADTPILVFDEPFANLDIDACLQVQKLFRTLKDEGKTLILSHHDLHSVLDLATHVVLLREGRLVGAGACAETFTAENIRKTYQVDASFVPNTRETAFLRFRPLT